MLKLYTTILSLFCFALSCTTLDAQCFTEQNYTSPGDYTFTVPGSPSVDVQIEIETVGADGGAFMWGSNPPSEGGEGAAMKASFVVKGGDELLIVVGQRGSNGIGSPAGGGGGGGTAVILNGTDVLIAAGAGGGGGQGAANVGQGGQANTDSPAEGGAGPGTSGGGGFNEDGEDGVAGSGGGAGTLTGGGVGGSAGVVAGPGGTGFGGGGGGSGTVGGGGGGYEGGDGASGSGGDLQGKGGDSFVNTGFSSVLIFNDAGATGGGDNDDGSVILTCVPLTDIVEIELVSQADATCFGESSGSIEVVAMGGFAPFTYTLDGGSANDTGIFTDVAAGTYIVAVSDANGAGDEITVTVGQPDEVIITLLEVIDNTCPNGAEGVINVEATGGNTPYTYMLNGVLPQTTGTYSGLPVDSYEVSVSDASGCAATLSVEVSSSSQILVSVLEVNNISCNGLSDGSAIIFAEGGNGSFTYSIDGGPFQDSDEFSGLDAGLHTVTAMDATGCLESVSFNIFQPDAVEAVVAESTNVSCNNGSDGSITVSASGGTGAFTYSIDDTTFVDSGTFGDLSAGSYTVIAKDANGCVDTVSTELIEPGTLSLEIVSQVDINCGEANTGAVTLLLTGTTDAVTYNFAGETNTTGIFTGLAAGSVTAFATTENGCMEFTQVVVGETSSIEVTLDSVSNVSCFGAADGTITVSATNGIEPYTYALIGGSFSENNTFSNLFGGVYTISAQDAEGCVSMISVAIDEPISLDLAETTVTAVSCQGFTDGEFSFMITGGQPPYMFDGMSIADDSTVVTVTNLPPGTTTVIVTDANDCEALLNGFIPEPAAIALFLDSIAPADCDAALGGTIVLSGGGGVGLLTYTLDAETSAGTFVDVPAGSYDIVGTDENGCSEVISITVEQVGGLTIDSFEVTDAPCFGGIGGSVGNIFTTGGNGIYQYALDGEVNTLGLFAPLAAGSYVLTVADENGCEASAEVTVGEPAELLFSSVTAMDVTCNGDMDGSITDIMVAGGTAPYTIRLEDTQPVEATFSDLEPGNYMLQVTDDNGCVSTQEVTVNEPDPVVVEVTDFMVDDGSGNGSITVAATGGNGEYMYSLDGVLFQDTGRFDDLRDSTYTILVVDANGCSAEVTQVLTSTTDASIAAVISLYPNPASELIAIDLPTSAEVQYTLLDSRGAALRTLRIGQADNFTVDISALASGVYVLQITTANYTATKRFIKAK